MPTIVDQTAPASYFKPTLARRTRKRYIGSSIRQSIQHVFEGLGGWEAMMDWAKANPTVFYSQVVPKLLPTELAEGGHGNGITVIVQRHSFNKDTEQSSKGSEVLSAQVSAVIEGGEIPDSRGQGMGPDLGTLTHEHSGTQPLTHEESGVPTQSGAGGTGGYFGRARTGKGSPTGG